MSHAPLRRLGAPFLAAALLAATLSACSVPAQEPSPDEPATQPAQAPSPFSTASAAPAVEKPERPAAMDKKNAEGAAAAAEYFLTLVPYVLLTGDTEEFKAMSHEMCGYCDNVLANENWLRETGADYAGGETRAKAIQRYDRDEVTGIYPSDLRASSTAVTIRDRHGEVIDGAPAEVIVLRAEVGTIDGDWVIVGISDAENEGT